MSFVHHFKLFWWTSETMIHVELVFVGGTKAFPERKIGKLLSRKFYLARKNHTRCSELRFSARAPYSCVYIIYCCLPAIRFRTQAKLISKFKTDNISFPFSQRHLSLLRLDDLLDVVNFEDVLFDVERLKPSFKYLHRIHPALSSSYRIPAWASSLSLPIGLFKGTYGAHGNELVQVIRCWTSFARLASNVRKRFFTTANVQSFGRMKWFSFTVSKPKHSFMKIVREPSCTNHGSLSHTNSILENENCELAS